MRIEDDLDYVALLHAARPLDGGQLLDVIRQFSHSGKPSRWLYWDPQACEWRTLDDMQHDRQYLELAATLQLADRRGAVEEQEMLHFCEALHGIITHLALTAEFPDRDAALARAARLDELGSMVDVQVGLNILAPKGMQFAFNRIADFAEKHGLSLAEDGTFVFSDGSDRLQYCLANLESARFSKTNLASGATQGVTLLMDIPKVTNGVAVFDQLTELGRKLAQTLGGSLVDDNHRPIDDAAIEKIKSQLSGIYSRMDNFPLHAGSTKALRLFS
jgi:hypothetical protein